MSTAWRALLCGLAFGAVALLAASSALQTELQDPDLAPHWIYDDLPAAREQARQSGKPLLVVLRCVPCPAGSKLDAALTHPTPELLAVEQQFVCVRVIKGQGLDLRLFQFDLDNSTMVFMLNADGTIYGRYGSRNGNAGNSDNLHSLAAAQKALERALELHRRYPGNAAQLAAKTGPAPAWAVPEQMPGLAERNVNPVNRRACIHCHMIREQQILTQWNAGTLRPADLYVYPLPETIGLQIDLDDGRRIRGVLPDSPANRAGLEVGDELIALHGQPLTSLADLQWVLHHLPATTTVLAQVRRGLPVLDVPLHLSGNWRQSDLAWRASSWAGLRHGLQTTPLTTDERAARGLAADRLALRVRKLFGNAQKVLPAAGLRENDLIVELGGQTADLDESRFLVLLRTTWGPQDPVKVTVLRGEQRLELTLPPW
ncbi:MAG: PDZ domain-containing protein [Fimbriimonadaceae bacterium]|nr:PDZ domain-containing protein [Fimbriimonadaceae bacterium]